MYIRDIFFLIVDGDYEAFRFFSIRKFKSDGPFSFAGSQIKCVCGKRIEPTKPDRRFRFGISGDLQLSIGMDVNISSI
ncbi:hypothetical protein [Parapedobacter defluvii]|uniref:hypothetical protein n=1 Tax=Parapedobacter defluvii TaxID=2045106 RepID=UPI001663B7C7|nr:hypothetical protein [Parapedobacter defluvii]